MRFEFFDQPSVHSRRVDPMKKYLLPLGLLCAPLTLNAQELTAYGNFKRMMHTGQTAGTVSLDKLSLDQAWGVGALAGLQGEIVIIDGKVLVSRGSDAKGSVSPPKAGDEAVILALGSVSDWHRITVPNTMTLEQLAIFVEKEALKQKVEVNKGFPFRVEGSFPKLVWHVVTGEKPKHGGSHAQIHGGGHANSKAGMIIFDEPSAKGEVIGIYTGSALEGIASHPGDKLHLHFVSEDSDRSGHIDELMIGAGAILKVPLIK